MKTPIKLNQGDRIELSVKRLGRFLPAIEVGTRGTVISETGVADSILKHGEQTVRVKWDTGRTVMLLLPHDKVKKVSAP